MLLRCSCVGVGACKCVCLHTTLSPVVLYSILDDMLLCLWCCEDCMTDRSVKVLMSSLFVHHIICYVSHQHYNVGIAWGFSNHFPATTSLSRKYSFHTGCMRVFHWQPMKHHLIHLVHNWAMLISFIDAEGSYDWLFYESHISLCLLCIQK